MAKKIFDLGSRFQSAFGFVPSNNSDNLERANFADAIANAEVYLKDTRSSFEEITLTRKVNNQPISFRFGYMGFLEQDESVFAPPVICSFRHGKRIGQTILSVNDANGNELEYGEVVENYGRKPVDITIRGVLIDMIGHKYPGDRVKRLMDLFYFNGSWAVEGQIFRDHKIQSIYFTDMEDAGVQGYEDTWSFSIEARSIKPVETSFYSKKKGSIIIGDTQTITQQQFNQNL